MSGPDFVKWMKVHELRVSDVASKTKLDPNTIYAFRRGKSVNPATKEALRRFVSDYEAALARLNVATG
jgi:hypothetical protein